ncbi:hypothetical protein [Aeromonas eucrenophila]|uniref:Uncharacterized protein n=1 Tax=Aeromonas eucrenophila TaxID=649 RepID=A0ABW0Y4Y7_9GAMM
MLFQACTLALVVMTLGGCALQPKPEALLMGAAPKSTAPPRRPW